MSPMTALHGVICFLLMLAPPYLRKANGHIFHSDAEITGIDKSTRPCNGNDPCNCPGGFFFHIDDMQDPQGKCISCNSFKALQLPADFTLDSHIQFPFAVRIDWQYDTLSCDSSRIRIINITKR